MAHLETELEQSRLRETETLGALREMQDKVLDMEKVRMGRWVLGKLWESEGGCCLHLRGYMTRPEPRRRGFQG